jgi:hypothetical protein
MEALTKIQAELEVPKDEYNSFGKYYYRTCGKILMALKPLLIKYNAQLTLPDELVLVGQHVFVKSTAILKCGNEIEQVSAFARHSEDKKGMDDSQITGSTSSYARKTALSGLFLLDDEKDSDSTDNGTRQVEAPPTAPKQPKAKVTLAEALHNAKNGAVYSKAIVDEVTANNYPIVPSVQDLAKFIEERPTITKFAELVKTWVNVEADKGSAQ